MDEWLAWARGPAFRLALAILLLGLLRVVALNTICVLSLIRKAKRNGRSLPLRRILAATLKWIFPLKRVVQRRWVFSLTSVVFHAAILVTPLFLAAHIRLWERGLGIGWPAIGNQLADWGTLVAIVAGLGLFVERLAARANRAISRIQDYLWPLLIVLPFASGYLAMHPGINPFAWNATMFVHVMSGNLILLLMPFSKLSHLVLFPATQLVSELGWFLEPESGPSVMLTLKKENEPV